MALSGHDGRIPIHNRTYACEAFRLPDADGRQRMLVTGRVTDIKPLGVSSDDGEPITIHDMIMELTVDAVTFEILAVSSTMETHPYDTCVDVLGDYQQLVGRSITRGYTKLVRELFGGPNGCSHVGALLIAMGPVAIQASWGFHGGAQSAADQLASRVDGEERERRLRLNTNTCHVWAEGGAHLAALVDQSAMPEPGNMGRRLLAVAERNNPSA